MKPLYKTVLLPVLRRNGTHAMWLSKPLLRNHQQVIYQHSPQTFELWNNRGEYVRYFPSERRSVSYRKGDLLSLNMNFDFKQLNHLISPTTIADMQRLPRYRFCRCRRQ